MKLTWKFYRSPGKTGWWWCGRDATGEIRATITFDCYFPGSGAAFVPRHGLARATVEYRTMANGMEHGTVVRDERTSVATGNAGDKWARAIARQWRKG